MAPTIDDLKLTDEAGRLAALDRYQVLDTGREPGFDRITNLVKTVFNMPICAVSLVDRDRQWFKSIQGLDVTETPRSMAFCDHTIRSREPMAVGDATADPRFGANPLVTDAPGIRSYAGVPLETPDGYNIGALCVIDVKPREITPSELEILRKFAGLVVDELELRTIAHKDFLTGAATRRAFADAVSREIAAIERTRHPSSFVLFDIDHFKRINDRFGHPSGDEVLVRIATVCGATLRPTDMLGRVGGEEFALLLPGTDITNALAVAERLRRDIAALRFDALGPEPVTASFGIAQWRPGDDFASWSAAADVALYKAKQSGRNRAALAER